MAKPRIPKFGQYGNELVNETEPTFGDGTETDAQPADGTDDPMSALSALLSDGGIGAKVPPAAPSNGGRRNDVLAQGIAHKYGLGPDAAAGSSQTDLEALDSFMRSGALSDKIAGEVAPINAKGHFDLASEGMKGQTARDVENMKGDYGLRDEAMKGQTARDVEGMKLSGSSFGGGDGNDTIDYWAKAATNDSSLLSKLPTAMKGAVAARMAQTGGTVETPTNQQKQMSETANDLLDVIDRAGGWQGLQGLASNLQTKGLFNPVIGPIRQFAAKHGAGTLLGVDDATASDVGYFNNISELLSSGLARAHAGARGAGNNEMAERFRTLIGGIGDFPTFVGQLQGIKTLLEQYASHTNPHYAQMVSPANDPYASPDYQPK